MNIYIGLILNSERIIMNKVGLLIVFVLSEGAGKTRENLMKQYYY